jgi:hypothetical protein
MAVAIPTCRLAASRLAQRGLSNTAAYQSRVNPCGGKDMMRFSPMLKGSTMAIGINRTSPTTMAKSARSS